MFLHTGGKSDQFHCAYCNKDITQNLRIRCAECDETDFCGDCFASGVNINSHKNYHSYYVVDCIETSIFTKDWTVAEELLLLEGMFWLILVNLIITALNIYIL